MSAKTATFKAAMIQMRSGLVPAANIDAASRLITEAKAEGADYVQTPEMTNLLAANREQLFATVVEEKADPSLAAFRDLARKHALTTHVGSLAIKHTHDRAVNRGFVIDPQGEIAARYGSRFLQQPQVSVFIKEFASQRVTVEGAVKKSGIFPMASRLSLLQAIALAEGLDDTASLRNVLVFRTAGGQRMVARFDLDAIREGRAEDPILSGDDVVVVDDSAGKLWLKQFIQLTPIITSWIVYSHRR